jgi:DNA-binding NarL/FixJ family response regulator
MRVRRAECPMNPAPPPEPFHKTRPGILRILLADDCPTTRARFRAELESLPQVEVVADAATSGEALVLFFTHHPHVLLVSTCLPPGGGFEVLQCIHRAAPGRSVILTTRSPNSFVEQTGQMLGAAGVYPVSHDFGRIREMLLALQGQIGGEITGVGTAG